MSPNRRILLNILATYGRSLFALFCGLFTSRWVLMGLGVEAYGVFGVIGVVITICLTINVMISGAVSRFYAFAFGKAKVAEDKSAALDECRGWFNVAFALHVFFPVIFVIAGGLAGSWAIENYFNIPVQYKSTAHWVLYFSLANMFIGMWAAPFRAMYTAQQYIAELTLYDFFCPLFSVICAWLLLHYQGDRLWFYACYTMVISAVPSFIIMVRAMFVFPECKIMPSKMLDWSKIRQLVSFAGWHFFGLLGLTVRTQGAPILVNKLLGVQFNSTMTVASVVSGHASSLSESLNGAFSPAITNAAGAADCELLYKLALRSSKFGTLLVSIFALPLCVEIQYIIQLWLHTVPPMVEYMCVLMLAIAILDRMGMGALVAINALGDVKLHELFCCAIHIVTLCFCFFFAHFMRMGIVGIGYGLLVGTALLTAMRMALWKWQLHLPIRAWLCHFTLPFAIILLASGLSGYVVTLILPSSFVRVLISAFVSVLVLGGLGVGFVLDDSERQVIRKFATRFLRRNA